jgi:hypothetical protein
MLSFGSGYKTGKSPARMHPATSIVLSGINRAAFGCRVEFGAFELRCNRLDRVDRYEHAANLQIKNHLAGSAVR